MNGEAVEVGESRDRMEERWSKEGWEGLESITPRLGPTCEASSTHRRGTSSNQVWEWRLWEKPGGVLPLWAANQTNHLSESLAWIKMERSARKADFPGLASQLHCHSSRQMTYGFLPTCVQTNQLWPADSRSYHICESETTFLGAPLQAYPPVRLCRAREQGLACCWDTEHFQQPWICHHGDLREVLLSWVDTGQMNALGLQMLLPAGKHRPQLARRQPKSADQHPTTASFPNTQWTDLDSALGLHSGGEWQGEVLREWS